jgi:hypothetical protein
MLAVLFFSAGLVQPAGAEPTKEYQLKAAFLYNFAKFIEWPAHPAGSADPIVIGVVGVNPFGDALLETIRGRKVGGHSIVVKFSTDPAGARGADLVFVPAGMARKLKDINKLFGAGVLIVGDSPDMMQTGATIAFKQQGDKLRFEIDMAEAARDGLKISAQLQKLASRIHR